MVLWLEKRVLNMWEVSEKGWMVSVMEDIFGLEWKMKNLHIGQTFHTCDKVSYGLASSSSPQKGREFEPPCEKT
jgi:hypothetical protein